MTQPPIIVQIEKDYQIDLKPFKDGPLEEQVRYVGRGTYALDEQGAVCGLNLCGTPLTAFDYWAELPALQMLNLSETPLTELHVPATATRLTHLNVSECAELRTLRLDGPLPALQVLDLNESAVSELALPAGLDALEYLDASRGKLESLTFGSACPALWWLDLSQNQLGALVLPGSFEKLQFLYLGKNTGLKTLAFGGAMPVLDTLHLRETGVEVLPENLLDCTKLETLYLYGHNLPNTYVPKEVIPTGENDNAKEALFAYLGTTDRIPLLEAKLILVGNGEVGKTSIQRRLIDPNAPLPGKNERTPGLEITPYVLSGLQTQANDPDSKADFKLNIWDFGGQGRYREIQQLFCSRKSLYLFVTAHDDKPENDNYIGFEYWLSMVNTYGHDRDENAHSPVIHVVNKIDEAQRIINQKDCNDLFPNVNKFVAISAQTLKNWGDLTQNIIASVGDISTTVFTDEYSKNWLKAKDALEARRGDNHINMEEYLKVCKGFEMNESDARAWLGILDRIGSVIYFKNHEELKDWIVLNPSWIKDALFKIMDTDLIRDDGYLYKNDLSKIWKVENDTRTKEEQEAEQEHLIKMMEAYQLCYPQVDNRGKLFYVVPARLSTEAPYFPPYLSAYPADRVRHLFEPFLPAGIVNKLMVKVANLKRMPHGQDLEELGKGKTLSIVIENPDYCWRNNVIFRDTDNNTYAHVREDWEQKSVFVNLYGEPDKIEPLHEFLEQAIKDLNKGLADTKYMREPVVTPQIWMNKLNKWVDIETVLGLDKPLFQVNKAEPDKKKKKKAFLMYSSKDENHRKELHKHLNVLKDEGWLEVWYDGDVEAGQLWDQTIQQNLNTADIIIMLLSVDFHNTAYIQEIELNIAYQRKDRAAIVPIFLREFYLGSQWYLKHQGPGKHKKWIAAMDDKDIDAAWTEITAQIQKICVK